MRPPRFTELAAAAVGTVGMVAVLSGAGVTPKAPATPPPAVTALSPAAQRFADGEATRLLRDSAARRAKQLTLRVRNVSCFGVATGSGFAIDHHTVITNRHVLAGADDLELNLWDGGSMTAGVSKAHTGRLVDIGVAVVPRWLPVVAHLGPEPRPGDRITAVGYPLGGPLTLAAGRVVRYRDGRRLSRDIAFPGRVMEVSAKVKHGNSGGPVLDAKGRVVGVIYAGEPGRTERDYARTAYAIPISEMRTLIHRGGKQPVVPCEE
jgi:S1-C subfamily serine protease